MQDQEPGTYKVYKRRWAILLLFVFYSASNSMQWIQFSIITNIIIKFYEVDNQVVDLTSMIYMILYIPMIFPACWFLDKVGLRITAIVGSCGTCVGSIVKTFCAKPDRFLVAFIGQAIVAVSQVCIISLPARLAAVWFGPDQVSSACAIGVFGNQLGVALSFVLPPYLVANRSIDEIGHDLQMMFCYVALITGIILILILIFFQNKPPIPPSAAEDTAHHDGGADVHFRQSLKSLFTNRNYILLLISYGTNVGVFYAISTVLNIVVLNHYPGSEVHVGQIGLSIVFCGMLGSIASGFILDKTHKFKETTLVIYAASMLGMWLFTFTLSTGHISVVYLAAGLLGFFMTGYLPIGFEFGAELTYPEPEGTSSGILNCAAQAFGILLTAGYSAMVENLGDVKANVTMASVMVLGTIITAVIGSDLRRQRAQNLVK